MIKAKKVLSSVLIMLFTLISIFNYVPAQAAGKPAVVPQVQFANAPVTEYMVGDRVGFNIYSPNYGGRVEYRVVLWNDSKKSYSDLWDAYNGYPTRYYTKWQPYGNNIFTLGWIINEPGSYRITVYAKRVGIPNSKGALKGYNCDSFMESVAFRVKSKEATVQSILPPADVTVNQGAVPVLPSTVRAVMSDATQRDLRVTWGTVNTTSPGTFVIPGTVEGTSLKTSLRLIVNPLQTSLNVYSVEADSINTVKVTLREGISFTPELSRFSLKEYGNSSIRLYSLYMSTDKKTIQISTETLKVGTWYILKVDGKEYQFQVPYSGYKVSLTAKDIEVDVNKAIYPDITVYPTDAKLTFVSMDEDIATYNEYTGKIEGVSPGTTTFYVMASKTGMTSAETTFDVKVKGETASLSVTPSTLKESLDNDGSLQTDVITVKPVYGTFKSSVSEDKVWIEGLPDGLDFDVTSISSSSIKIKITGNANNHSNSDDTSFIVYVDNGSSYGYYGFMMSNEVKIDFFGTAPTAPQIGISPTTATNNNVVVTITYPATAVVMQYKIGQSGTYTDYSSPFNVTENTTIYAKYQLNTGVWSAEAKRAITNIDKTGPAAPTIKINKTTPAKTVTVSITYPNDAVIKQYKIGDGVYRSYGGSFTVDENVTIYAIGIDQLGNVGTEASLSITNIDNDPPDQPAITRSPVNNGAVTITITYPSDAVTKQYKIGIGGQWKTYSSTITVKQNGTIYARAVDAAGNESISSIEITDI